MNLMRECVICLSRQKVILLMEVEANQCIGLASLAAFSIVKGSMSV